MYSYIVTVDEFGSYLSIMSECFILVHLNRLFIIICSVPKLWKKHFGLWSFLKTTYMYNHTITIKRGGIRFCELFMYFYFNLKNPIDWNVFISSRWDIQEEQYTTAYILNFHNFSARKLATSIMLFFKYPCTFMGHPVYFPLSFSIWAREFEIFFSFSSQKLMNQNITKFYRIVLAYCKNDQNKIAVITNTYRRSCVSWDLLRDLWRLM